MEDPPPPYPWSEFEDQSIERPLSTNSNERYVGYVRLPSTQVHQITPYSLAEHYKYRHDVYVTTIATRSSRSEHTDSGDQTEQSISALHILSTESSTLDATPNCLHFPSGLAAEDLEMVSGFHDLGSFTTTREANLGKGEIVDEDVENVNAVLGLQLQRHQQQQQRNLPVNQAHPTFASSSIDSDTHLNQDAGSSPISEPAVLAVHVYKIHLFTQSLTEFCDGYTEGSKTTLLFNWAKSHSVYGDLRGFSQTSLPRVIKDAAFRGGRGVMLLARAVTDDQMRELRERREEGMSVTDI